MIKTEQRGHLENSVNMFLFQESSLIQQAGNGISRRHIYGSKIAKGHESVKNLKISNSQKEYQTHEKPKRQRGPLVR